MRRLYQLEGRYKTFGREQLHRLRAKLHHLAVKRAAGSREREGQRIEAWPTWQDLDHLMTYYLARIPELVHALAMPSPKRVVSTASHYLKKFYLYPGHSVLDFHPKTIMLSALFLAGKTCSSPAGGGSIDEFLNKIPKTTREDVLGHELELCQALNFDLSVADVYAAAKGILLDLHALEVEVDAKTMAKVEALLDKLLLTDLTLLYTASQCAASAFFAVDETLTRQWCNNLAIPALENELSVEELMALCSKVALELEAWTEPGLAKVKEIDKLVKTCRNLARVPGSKVYQEQKALEEERRLKASQRKRQKVASGDPIVDEDDDPFL